MRAKEWRARAQADLLLAKDQDFIRGADGVDLIQEEDEVSSPCPWERRSRGQAVQGNADPVKTMEGAFKESSMRALSTLAAPTCNGLLNVLVQLDGREVQATISIETAHNFLAEKVARELGLTIVSDDTLKATGVADAEGALGRTEATLTIGPRKGRCSFIVFPLDGYQIILGLDLCTKAEIMIIPHRPGILVWAHGVPTFVPASVWKPDA